MSISSTFYERVFGMKANFSSYVWLCNFLARKFLSSNTLMKLTAGVNLFNILIEAFMHEDPKSAKMTVKLLVILRNDLDAKNCA